MNKLLIILLLITYSFSYEQGYIDMHGGKNSKIANNNNDFIIKSLEYLLKAKNKKDNNQSKIKYLKIDDIDKINF